MNVLGQVRCLFCRVWATPSSLLGLIFGLVGVLFGDRCQYREGCLEFYGGLLNPVFNWLPNDVVAMTLGHIILSRSRNALNHCRTHEHVHVRQYEKWGPLFLPAYLTSSIYLWVVGRDPYRDNPFEKEAYRVSEPTRNLCSGTSEEVF